MASAALSVENSSLPLIRLLSCLTVGLMCTDERFQDVHPFSFLGVLAPSRLGVEFLIPHQNTKSHNSPLPPVDRFPRPPGDPFKEVSHTATKRIFQNQIYFVAACEAL